MTFGNGYGSIAALLIQVHYVWPLSEIRCECRVNRIEDLRPIYLDCHAFIHLKKPPLSIQEALQWPRPGFDRTPSKHRHPTPAPSRKNGEHPSKRTQDTKHRHPSFPREYLISALQAYQELEPQGQK